MAIDSGLMFEDHVSLVIRRSYATLDGLAKFAKRLTKQGKKMIVNPRPVGLLPDPARRRGGAVSAPPAISETTEAILKIQTGFDSPLKVLLGNQISLTSGSPMTSQVRSNKMFPLFNC